MVCSFYLMIKDYVYTSKWSLCSLECAFAAHEHFPFLLAYFSDNRYYKRIQKADNVMVEYSFDLE